MPSTLTVTGLRREVRDLEVEGLGELLRQPGEHAHEQLRLLARGDAAAERQHLDDVLARERALDDRPGERDLARVVRKSSFSSTRS